jgi:hypothetical protein
MSRLTGPGEPSADFRGEPEDLNAREGRDEGKGKGRFVLLKG